MAEVDSFTITSKPQEPAPPYPYLIENVAIPNLKDSITLSGTLTIPADTIVQAAAILISGSGPQDRDEYILGHRPFKLIADYLTRQGIAVLRYDDRGVGQSTGDCALASIDDFASDALAAFEYLQADERIPADAIGMIGHSEGGMVAPMAAVSNDSVAYIVMLAGPGVSGAKVLIDQNLVILGKAGMPAETATHFEHHFSKIVYARVEQDDYSNVEQIIDTESKLLFDHLNPFQKMMLAGSAENYAKSLKDFLQPSWAKSFLAFEPSQYLMKVKCPIFALNGEKDVQVTPDLNLNGIQAILESADHPDYTVQLYPGLNHLFQTALTGMPAEYGSIDETIAPVVLSDISDWILERFGHTK